MKTKTAFKYGVLLFLTSALLSGCESSEERAAREQKEAAAKAEQDRKESRAIMVSLLQKDWRWTVVFDKFDDTKEPICMAEVLPDPNSWLAIFYDPKKGRFSVTDLLIDESIGNRFKATWREQAAQCRATSSYTPDCLSEGDLMVSAKLLIEKNPTSNIKYVTFDGSRLRLPLTSSGDGALKLMQGSGASLSFAYRLTADYPLYNGAYTTTHNASFEASANILGAAQAMDELRMRCDEAIEPQKQHS